MPALVILVCLLVEHLSRYLLSGFITLSYNPGIALDILNDMPGLALILSGFACTIIVFACFFVRMRGLTRLGLALMAGGALSNILERLILGHVIDWIPLPFFDLNFNLADVAISLGALIVFVS